MVFFKIHIKVCLLIVIISTLFLSCLRNQPQQAIPSSDMVVLKEINLEKYCYEIKKKKKIILFILK